MSWGSKTVRPRFLTDCLLGASFSSWSPFPVSPTPQAPHSLATYFFTVGPEGLSARGL